MQVFQSTNTPVSATRNLTLVAEGVVGNTTASNSSANTTAAQQPTARQFEVQMNFTLQPPGTSPSPPAAPGISPSPATAAAAPLVTPESPGNATVVTSNSSGGSNAAAGNAAAGNAAAGNAAAGNAATNNAPFSNAAVGNAAADNAAAGNTAAGNATAGNAAAGNAGGSNLARKLQQQQQQQQQQQPPTRQPGEYIVGLRILTGSGTYTDVCLRGLLVDLPAAAAGVAGQQGAASATAAAAAIGNLSVWVDRTHAGNTSNTTWIEGGPVPLPVNASQAWTVPQQPLGLSVFVDHSVIEVYALGGLARVSSRIYPEGDDVAWGLQVLSSPPRLAVGGSGGGGAAWDVLVDASVWEMHNAWLAPDC
jgi:hypothetical protein